jgi:hypothetical protein
MNTSSGSPLFIRDVADVGECYRLQAMTLIKEVQSVKFRVGIDVKGHNSNVVIKKRTY